MINPNGSNIPQARETLHGILRVWAGALPMTVVHDINDALSLMSRAKPVRRSAVKHRGWADPLLKQEIQHCLAAHTDWSLQQVSIHCNTNTARVSEVATGLV